MTDPSDRAILAGVTLEESLGQLKAQGHDRRRKTTGFDSLLDSLLGFDKRGVLCYEKPVEPQPGGASYALAVSTLRRNTRW